MSSSSYSDPAGQYLQQRKSLRRQKGLEDSARTYAQGLSQERFRRNREDQTIGFQRSFPKVGQSFNRRGMWNSGMRKQGQQQQAGDFKRNLARTDWDQGAQNQGFEMEKASANARYRSALQEARDQMKRAQSLQGAYNQAKVY